MCTSHVLYYKKLFVVLETGKISQNEWTWEEDERYQNANSSLSGECHNKGKQTHLAQRNFGRVDSNLISRAWVVQVCFLVLIAPRFAEPCCTPEQLH